MAKAMASRGVGGELAAATRYVGIDWAYRRAAWCALSEAGVIVGDRALPAAENELAKLVLALGTQVKACGEMMSGAIWVRDRLEAAGWWVQVAHAGKVGDVAPLACKSDKVNARVLAELCRRDLVPELWIPSLDDRALRERLRRRMHFSSRAQAHRLRRPGPEDQPVRRPLAHRRALDRRQPAATPPARSCLAKHPLLSGRLTALHAI
jgi:hypothetical protein